MRLALGALVILFAACVGQAASTEAASPVGPTTEPPPTDGSIQCGGQLEAASLTVAQAKARNGESVDRFSGSANSLEKPIEVCGVPGQITWLMVGRCDNSTNPFKIGKDAHASRVGSVGETGPCNHIVDRYQVECPEKTYDVFFNMYMCGPGETLHER